MALGQSGPPASAKQVAYLQVLLEKAGFATFREARRAYGLTQRQASGKFTKQEASELIDRLINGDQPDEGQSVADALESGKVAAATDTQARLLKGMPAQWLADELLSRGWSVQEPR
ncbi:MAG: hypothetical protein HY828_19300 [Actinobacteria bacterium]|nr:hypothetical protein [Actinomycetota bacterium]